ncbi:MAG: hypothetical protein QOG62_2810 [Thermoleophilaceae bacterium]|jgi:metallophosphoesterase (TIGR03767 family)|nr:hypothetical protein [Thermoleophilaceae bacterium]
MVMAAVPATAVAANSTLDSTITGDHSPAAGYSQLASGPGETYTVRQDLGAPAGPGRAANRDSLAYFGQLSDFQLPDEESPGRAEFLDIDPSGSFSAAYRPQEALLPQMADQSVRAMNQLQTSPVAEGGGGHASMGEVLLTGDLADSKQLNETQWVRTILEGGSLDPNSGTTAGCIYGKPSDAENPTRYTGVADYSDYLLDSDEYWDPSYPSGPYAGWPSYPGLLDRAQKPFTAAGLNVPSYVAFGNHDGLVQGNQNALGPIEAVAVGCVKPLVGVSTTLVSPTFLNTTPLSQLGQPKLVQKVGTQVMLVPPDPKRQYVDKKQYKTVFENGTQADGHGFDLVDPAELAASKGAASYYAFDDGPIRFIGLDTVSEAGVIGVSADGNLDAPQFAWLQRELQDAQNDGQLIVVFGHHAPSTSLTANVPDELAGPCLLNNKYGHDINPGCDRDPRSSSPIKLGADVTNLLLSYKNVIAVVAGHSHNSRVTPISGPNGGYWEIKSPAVADWPVQNRAIEVMDNHDGTLSIFGTMADSSGPVTAPGAGNASSFSAETLASIGRTVAWNDPQAGPLGGAAGSPTDRNVELLIKDPR